MIGRALPAMLLASLLIAAPASARHEAGTAAAAAVRERSRDGQEAPSVPQAESPDRSAEATADEDARQPDVAADGTSDAADAAPAGDAAGGDAEADAASLQETQDTQSAGPVPNVEVDDADPTFFQTPAEARAAGNAGLADEGSAAADSAADGNSEGKLGGGADSDSGGAPASAAADSGAPDADAPATSAEVQSPEPATPEARAAIVNLSPELESPGRPAGRALSALQAVVADFHQSMRENYRDGVLRTLDPEIVVFETGYAQTGRDTYAAEQLDTDLLYAATVGREVLHSEAYVDHGMGYVITLSHRVGSFGGQTIDLLNTETAILRLGDDGWKIVHIHWSGHDLRQASP